MVKAATGAANSLREVAQRIESGQVMFGQCTAHKTRHLARKVMAHFEGSIASLGIKGTQFALMGCVLRDGPIKPSDLAKAMELSASTLSRNVQPLIAQGLLVMRQGSDARSRLLSITPDGKKLWIQAGKRWQAAQVGLGQQMGVAQLAALHGMLDSALSSLTQTATG
jgi:DNA-binding MarR family transcriptional regulator